MTICASHWLLWTGTQLRRILTYTQGNWSSLPCNGWYVRSSEMTCSMCPIPQSTQPIIHSHIWWVLQTECRAGRLQILRQIQARKSERQHWHPLSPAWHCHLCHQVYWVAHERDHSGYMGGLWICKKARHRYVAALSLTPCSRHAASTRLSLRGTLRHM